MRRLHIHYFQHVPFEGLGCIADWISGNGHTVTATRWYEQPATPDISAADWLIIMGGPMGVYDEAQYPWLQKEKQLITQAIQEGKRVLGICLGAQLAASVLGADVYANGQKEIGWFPVQFSPEGAAAPLAAFLPPELTVFHWHGDTFTLPEQAVRFASTPACINQAFVYNERVIGLQFHFEVTPRSLEEMIQHGRYELAPAVYIQDAAAIEGQQEHIPASNAVMYRLLDHISGL